MLRPRVTASPWVHQEVRSRVFFREINAGYAYRFRKEKYNASSVIHRCVSIYIDIAGSACNRNLPESLSCISA